MTYLFMSWKHNTVVNAVFSPKTYFNLNYTLKLLTPKLLRTFFPTIYTVCTP